MNKEQAFTEGLKRLAAKHPFMKFDLDWNTGIAILACLQLSLRHPGNTGPSAALARGFVDGTIRVIEGIEPELAALLRLGDDPRHDQKARA